MKKKTIQKSVYLPLQRPFWEIHNGSSIEVLEENNYYPFGLKHEGYNALAGNTNYNYKYNGKELQETGMYDYGARFYMPDIGRWGVVDPLAEASRRFTPYHYGNNNPIRFIDPDGRLTMDNLGTYNRGSAVADFNRRNGFGDDHLPMLYSDDAGMMIVNEALGDNGQGGGSGDPKPSFWQRAGNFFRNLFRGKSKQADVLPITGAAARPIQVGQLEKVGRVLTIEQVTAALATIMGKSVWALPLMLNGDSAGAPAYDVPLTGATDVPADEPLGVLLYRGIAAPKNALQLEMYSQGLVGTAIPNGLRTVSTLKGPHRSQDLHAEGDNYSIWTSWTTDPIVAKHFSGGTGGIILSRYFRAGQAIPNLSITAEGNSIPSGRPESEWLVPGIVYGASVQIIK